MSARYKVVQISIHALREESDTSKPPTSRRPARFQSTLSVRRATQTVQRDGGDGSISIHALREESDHIQHQFQRPDRISIHALREESDTNA